MGEERNVYMFVAGKLRGKRPLGKPRSMLTLEDGMGYLTQNKIKLRDFVTLVMNLQVQSNVQYFLVS
jgi:hypothetical protein